MLDDAQFLLHDEHVVSRAKAAHLLHASNYYEGVYSLVATATKDLYG